MTQNRDESPARVANGLVQRTLGREQLLFPQDGGAGGSWIAVSQSGRIATLLNGAFTKHRHQPPYRRSRGLMVLDFFAFKNARQFFQQYTFAGMEPFTMIIYDHGQLFEFRWDGRQTHIHEKPVDQPHLWASSTLYPEPIQQKRQRWFREWLTRQKSYNPTTVLHFHRTAGDGDPFNDLVMNRDNIVCTTSITLIDYRSAQINMQYHDLLRQQSDRAGQQPLLLATDQA